jgi:16S rRNA (adenine1518-N6/adenine1519-N6)-dimethyltransferase
LLPEPVIPAHLLPVFFRLAKAGFSQKRKTLRNSISAGLAWKPPKAEALLRSAGIDPMQRAETLGLADWSRLVEEYQKQGF